MRGLENILVDVMLNQEMVDYLQERFVSFFIEDFYRTMEASGRRIDVFWALTDLGTQERLLMGRDAHGALHLRSPRPDGGGCPPGRGEGDVPLLRRRAGGHPRPDRCGVDILNPLQPAAKGMEPAASRKTSVRSWRFTAESIFSIFFPMKSPETVAAETRRVAGILGRDGGYVLSPSHNIQLDTSTDNILAMYRPQAREI